MSSDDLDQMLPEYDFSDAVRGRYTERFRESRDAILTTASAMDRQAWLAHSLLEVQSLEAGLVAYWSLALDTLIAERNWLVHRSFNSESSSRLEAIVGRSRKLNLQLSKLLLERCTSSGMPPEEVETRTQEVVEEWASGRNAA